MSRLIAALLIAVTLTALAPAPARAQTLGVECLASFLFGVGTSAVGGAIGTVGAAAGLFVPVFDAANFTQNSITAAKTSALQAKSVADCLATALLKTAIAVTRDIIIKWIITGRFEGPVFSASFAVDAKQVAENASRIFLSQLTGIDFCAGITVPPQALFALNVNLALTCTFPGDYNQFLNGDSGDLVQLWASERTANNIWNVRVAALDAKLQAEHKALSAFIAEYQAGQGFLGIRDPNTGRITTPGSAVAKLVMESQIVSPIRQTDVADDIQTAIAAIIDTAIKVLIEKGLGAAFGSK